LVPLQKGLTITRLKYEALFRTITHKKYMTFETH
jgi:hypothetical protein